MKKFLNKLEGMLGSVREAINENDGSTLQTISNSIKSGYENVKDTVTSNEKTQRIWEDIKGLGDDFAQAVKKGDKKLSSKTLDALEKRIKDYKSSKNEDKDEKKPEAAKPAAMDKAKPAAASKSAAGSKTSATAAKPASKAAAKPAGKVAPKAGTTSAKKPAASKPAANAAKPAAKSSKPAAKKSTAKTAPKPAEK